MDWIDLCFARENRKVSVPRQCSFVLLVKVGWGEIERSEVKKIKRRKLGFLWAEEVEEGLHCLTFGGLYVRAKFWYWHVDGCVCEACIMKMGHELIIFGKSEENHEKFDRVGRSQGVSHANRHLADSAAFRYTNSLKSIPICLWYCFIMTFLQINLIQCCSICMFWMSKEQVLCWFLAWLILRPWWW
jgi:hypothetical protein